MLEIAGRLEPNAVMIREERAAGRAPDWPDADVLASVLLELNDRMLERLAARKPAFACVATPDDWEYHV